MQGLSDLRSRGRFAVGTNGVLGGFVIPRTACTACPCTQNKYNDGHTGNHNTRNSFNSGTGRTVGTPSFSSLRAFTYHRENPAKARYELGTGVLFCNQSKLKVKETLGCWRFVGVSHPPRIMNGFRANRWSGVFEVHMPSC